MGSEVYVIFEGRRYSRKFLEAVIEWRRLAIAAGIPFRITQGGHNAGAVSASSGTHDLDGIDVSVYGLTEKDVATLVRLGRSVGICVWFRTTKVAKWRTRAQGFGSYHLHGVPNLWGYLSPAARNQAESYRNGRDGLRANLADIGPGHVATFRTRTWDQYKAIVAAQTSSKEEPELSEEMIRKIIREELIDRPVEAGGATKTLFQHELDDLVMGKARSAALADIRNQISSVAKYLGVEIRKSSLATVAAIDEQLDTAIHDAMAEHFPSMEKAEADQIANTIFDRLVTQFNKE